MWRVVFSKLFLIRNLENKSDVLAQIINDIIIGFEIRNKSIDEVYKQYKNKSWMSKVWKLYIGSYQAKTFVTLGCFHIGQKSVLGRFCVSFPNFYRMWRILTIFGAKSLKSLYFQNEGAGLTIFSLKTQKLNFRCLVKNFRNYFYLKVTYLIVILHFYLKEGFD